MLHYYVLVLGLHREHCACITYVGSYVLTYNRVPAPPITEKTCFSEASLSYFVLAFTFCKGASSSKPRHSSVVTPKNRTSKVLLANMSGEPIRVTVTGAAGQIAYSLLYQISSGN